MKFLILTKTRLVIGCFKEPTHVVMRVLLCKKIQCPSFICFSKPSPHIYTSGSLKLESTPQVSSSTTVVVDVNDDEHYVDAHGGEGVNHVDGLLNKVSEEEDSGIEEKEEDCTFEEKQEQEQGHSHGEILKSSLKKEALDSADGERMEKKKKVQWVDLIGKELAEIREFESSEEDGIIYDGDKSCVCAIL
ncbi:unnamed protein product [Eruca vesicaria subsp. sativa]|uniref:Uncharacterized protein n=1 Tax=Eruca vesicaria subsp. sativa TaxID=29727 RepID=A0ABC8L6X0_ERUVS|nr:unnamed protein product [Eruca vesicaria subsp. sativa]